MDEQRIGTSNTDPYIVQTNAVERLRFTQDGWILIGGTCRGSAPVEIDTRTGQVIVNKPGEIDAHAKTFFECLSVIFPTMRQRWILEETERCAKVAETMDYNDHGYAPSGYSFSSEEYEFGWQMAVAKKIRESLRMKDE